MRGFAFVLGLTTLLDLLVVFLFTHPVLQALVRTRFFGKGHPWSGLDPARLDRDVPAYAGRGRVRLGEECGRGGRRSARAEEEAAEREPIAVRRAREAREAREAQEARDGVPADGTADDDSSGDGAADVGAPADEDTDETEEQGR